jgi:aminoglycoside 3-N-acetyltransferase
MITVRDLFHGFDSLSLRAGPVIAHGSFKSLGRVQGGPKTVIDALLASTNGLMMPAFTYETMVYPRSGPDLNGMDYEVEHGKRRRGEVAAPVYFKPELPVDKEIGVLPETLRRNRHARRSLHPILSFTGVNVDFALERQSMEDPFAPIGALAEQNGWVLLIGVNHRVNTSIHYAERLAGRRQFLRWAATPRRVVECDNFPGDSEGFQEIAPYLTHERNVVTIGEARVEAIPLRLLIEAAEELVKQHPLALLCQRENCGRCNAVREMAR